MPTPAPQTYEVDFEPIGKRVEVLRHTTLLKAAQQAGLALSSACGRVGNCGQCRIALLEGQISSPTPHDPRSDLGRITAGLPKIQGEPNLMAESAIIHQMTPLIEEQAYLIYKENRLKCTQNM